MLFALADLEKRRLGKINVTRIKQRSHISEKECQQKRSDMSTVDIGIRHDNDLVISKLVYIEIFAYARTESGNDGNKLFICDNLVKA